MPKENTYFNCRASYDRVLIFTHPNESDISTSIRLDRITAWKVSKDKDLGPDGLFLDLDTDNGESFSFLMKPNDAKIWSLKIEALVSQ
jgi:hypothetical protein